MPTLSASARRRRSWDEVESEGEQESENGGAPALSQSNKRARIERRDGDPEESPSSPDALLPDSYRRSPRSNRLQSSRKQNTARPNERQKHHPGSIVRVELKDFVTYTAAEFHPGPNLNMIIGPNGTGKSTLVCAICLGLGWATAHLGRAKDVGEFVKHGTQKAEITVELAGDPERHDGNQIITTKITKDGNKMDYLINGRRSNRKGVQELARSFSIQIDNLCQFLPQDRVVEFAALSTVDLLTHTLRAAAPGYMTEWHDELKQLRKEEKLQKEEQLRGSETLKNLESRQRLQEADVERLRERTAMQERLAAFEKMRPFPQYNEAKNNFNETKQHLSDSKTELRRLELSLGPKLRDVEMKSHYLERIGKVVTQRKNLVTRGGDNVVGSKRKLDATSDKIRACVTEVESENQTIKTVKQSIPRHQQELQRIKRSLENPPPEVDFSEMNERIREKTRQIRDAGTRDHEIEERMRGLRAQVQQREKRIADKEKERNDLQSQAGQQANKLRQASQQTARAWEWVQQNRGRFSGTVYGPPMIECRVKDSRHADAVESMIPLSEMLALTVTSQEDFRVLMEVVYGTMGFTNVSIRKSTYGLECFKPAVPEGQLEQFGLESYLLSLIEGPEPVLAMLCDNRSIHQAAFTSKDISEAQFDAIRQAKFSSWVTPKQTYMITRRREYGDQATSTRVSALKPARFFTDVPVDRQLENLIDEAIRVDQGEIRELYEHSKGLKEERQRLATKKEELMSEKTDLEEEKNMNQRAISEFQGLPAKEDQAQRKLDEAQESVNSFKQRRREIEERQDKHCLEKGQQALDYANAVEALRGLHVQLFEAEILQIEAKSDLEQLQAQHEEEQRLLNEKEEEVRVLQSTKAEARAKAVELQGKCQELAENFTELEDELVQEVVQWDSDQLETEIQSTQARLEMTTGAGNENTLREFEKRAKSIEEKTEVLREVDAKLEELREQVADVRQRWEPKLDDLMSQISDAFAENFSQIQCAGEVTVYKDDDFEQWAIQIKVKFRENEALSVLDSHRQSGGERAVSTIFYLMALQSLARAPFRVVDEINQGMDPRNERMVHSRMVDIACDEYTSQYFLITPKLLQGLKYHPNMKVHCIASGEHMPESHDTLNFATLADKALAIRGRQGLERPANGDTRA